MLSDDLQRINYGNENTKSRRRLINHFYHKELLAALIVHMALV